MKKNLLLPAIFILLLQTLSFSQNLQWAFNIGATLSDAGSGIAIDKTTGDLYATGDFSGTVDFDPSPNIFTLTSNGGRDAFVAKYSSAGKFIWALKIGTSGDDGGTAVAVDPSGNLIVVGRLSTANGDIFLNKYTSAGTSIWSFSIGGTGLDQPGALEVSPAGNIYITGSFLNTVDFDPSAATYNLTSSSSGSDFFLAKYTSAGTLVTAFNHGNASGGDLGTGIVLDTTVSSIYVTGAFGGTIDFNPSGGNQMPAAGGEDIFVAKYKVNTTPMSYQNGGRPDNGSLNEFPMGIALDGSGNYFLTGWFQGTVDFDFTSGTHNLSSAGGNDIFLLKNDTANNFKWAIRVGGTQQDQGQALALDSQKDPYITGAFMGTVNFDPFGTNNLVALPGDTDIFVAKYSQVNGALQWAFSIKGIGNASCGSGGLGIKVDAANNIYVTGGFCGTADFDPGNCSGYLTSSGNDDGFIAKYSQNPPPVSICLATVDSFSTKNIIVWDKPVSTSIDSFRIYRDSSTGFLPVVTLPYSSLSEYTDNVNPNIHSYDYKISAIDNAGIESALSNRHETMFMQKTQPTPPKFNLTWNDYCGFPVTKYYIWRDGNNTNSWAVIDSVNFGSNVYVDNTPPTQNANYRIEAIDPQACAVTIKNPIPQTTTIKGTKSNTSYKVFGAGIIEYEKEPFLVLVYPNPSSGNFQLTISSSQINNEYKIKIYNLLGKLIYSSTLNYPSSSISLRDISSGVYHLQVSTKDGVVNRKIVIE